MTGRLDDCAYLVSSEHRVRILVALAEGPSDRTTLREETHASPPTVGRVLGDFEDRHWIERDGREYRLTGLGTFVADRLAEFIDFVGVERRLRDVAPWLPYELDGFSVDLLTDAVVSLPGDGYPYEPMDRNVQLMDETETIRGFGMVLLKSSILEDFYARVFDGLSVEMIYPPAVFETIYAWDPETVAEAIALDDHDVYLHEDLPNSEWCGICLTDEHVSICCYEPETGMLRSLVDTDAPDAYAWGESTVERYRAEAVHLDEESDPRSIASGT